MALYGGAPSPKVLQTRSCGDRICGERFEEAESMFFLYPAFLACMSLKD